MHVEEETCLAGHGHLPVESSRTRILTGRGPFDREILR